MLRKTRIVFIVLTVLWMTVIFCFSARPAEVSAKDSCAIGMAIGKVFVPGFSDMSVDEKNAFAAKIDHPVRKIAHATEYAILGFLMAGSCYSGKLEGRQRWIVLFAIPWALATAYATIDEIHQLFVSGRNGQFSDVCLDSVGALAGTLFLNLLRLLTKR